MFGWISGFFFVNIVYGIICVFVDFLVGVKEGDLMKMWNLIREEKCFYVLLMLYYFVNLINYKKDFNDRYLLCVILFSGYIID